MEIIYGNWIKNRNQYSIGLISMYNTYNWNNWIKIINRQDIKEL